MNTFLSVRSLTVCFVAIFMMSSIIILAQEKKDEPPKVEKKWFEQLSFRGYSQIRYNRLLETNKSLKCDQCDRSIGENGGLFIRRARLIIFGQIHPNVYVYIQPDFASNASSTNIHFLQIRDFYFDLGLNAKNEWRFRIGQSKVPFGFENMQSSQNRLPLDRADPTNSMVPNERDLGTFFYFAPDSKRQLFSRLVRDGLKGSGDYGIFGFGVYNGQAANKPELNNNLHMVGRLTYPFEFKNQIIEVSLQGIKGKYTLASDQLSANVKQANANKTYNDDRWAASFVLYPQPFGIQAEYNAGTGPSFDPATSTIIQRNLKGGYILLSYMTNIYEKQKLTPFARYQYFDGGKKLELDARYYQVKELEIGAEWQQSKNFELTASYVISKRRFEDLAKPSNLQQGRFLRIQAQVNF